MKIFLFLTLFSISAAAESFSGKWKFDSCLVLARGGDSCSSNIDTLELKISENPLKACFQYEYSDGTPQQDFCVEAYDNSQPRYDPLKDIVDKRELFLREDKKLFSSIVTSQSHGERKLYSLTFSVKGNSLAVYDYIFDYVYYRSTQTWEPTNTWVEESFYSLKIN